MGAAECKRLEDGHLESSSTDDFVSRMIFAPTCIIHIVL